MLPDLTTVRGRLQAALEGAVSDTAALDDLPGGIGKAIPLVLPLVFGRLDALTDEQLAAALRRVSVALAAIADGPDDVSRETSAALVPAVVGVAGVAYAAGGDDQGEPFVLPAGVGGAVVPPPYAQAHAELAAELGLQLPAEPDGSTQPAEQ